MEETTMTTRTARVHTPAVHANPNAAAAPSRHNCTPAARVTKSLLGYGVIAGPLYVVTALTQALTRHGFDLTKHSWSLLSNGALGWIQITNFVLTGLMTIAAAVGLRRALGEGAGRTWAPRLLAAYGACLVAAGTFRADPAQGFPVGTPDKAPVSWHGMMHLAVGSVGFLCLIVACFVLARRFTHDGQPRLAGFSRGTGAVFFVAFAGIASGSHGPVTLAFAAAVVIVCAWITTVSIHLYRTVDAA
jgi:FtsH-binding integral membrane protein